MRYRTLDRVPSFQELAKMEAGLLLKKLERYVQAVGVTFPELDKRIKRELGYHAMLFSGQVVFRLEDVFSVCYVIRQDPGMFFAEALPPNDHGDHPGLSYGLRKPS
jgi:hypothetical protein